MGLRWHGGPQALGVLSTSPTPPAPPEPPTDDSSTGQHVDTFQAVDAGSYNRYGWLQQQVWASDSYFGAWFYGSKIADTVPSFVGVDLEGRDLPVDRVALRQRPELRPPRLPKQARRTAAYTAVQALAPAPGWYQLPTAWGDALKDGGGQFGVGVNHGGKNIFRSRAQDGMTGALRITSTY